MKGRDLLEGLSFIDERFVEEAEHGRIRKRYWMQFTAMAACLCVILGAAFGLRQIQEPTEGEGTASPEMVPEIVTEATERTGGAEGAVGTAVERRELTVTVDEWTEEGFLATVVQSFGEFDAGMQIEVRRKEGGDWEIPEVGAKVILHSYTYDMENRIIYAKRIGKDE